MYSGHARVPILLNGLTTNLPSMRELNLGLTKVPSLGILEHRSGCQRRSKVAGVPGAASTRTQCLDFLRGLRTRSELSQRVLEKCGPSHLRSARMQKRRKYTTCGHMYLPAHLQKTPSVQPPIYLQIYPSTIHPNLPIYLSVSLTVFLLSV